MAAWSTAVNDDVAEHSDDSTSTPARPRRHSASSAYDPSMTGRHSPHSGTPAEHRSLKLSLGTSNGGRFSPSASEVDASDDDDDDESGVLGRSTGRLLPPQRLFGSPPAANRTVNVGPSLLDLGGSFAGKMPDVIGLLKLLRSPSAARADDHLRALLDEIAGPFVGRLDEATREAESRSRELDRLDRTIDRLIVEGATFGGPIHAGGSVDRDDDDDDDDSALDSESANGSTGDGRSLSNSFTTRAPSTPIVLQRHQTVEQSAFSLSTFATPPPQIGQTTFHPSHSPPFATSTTAPPLQPASLVALSLTDLASHSLSAANALSAVHDQAQIGHSAAAESARRVRALRASVVHIRSEEEAVERARREIELWEADRREETAKGEGVIGRRAQAEMRSVQRIMEAFEARMPFRAGQLAP